jgi:hypothetical protein
MSTCLSRLWIWPHTIELHKLKDGVLRSRTCLSQSFSTRVCEKEAAPMVDSCIQTYEPVELSTTPNSIHMCKRANKENKRKKKRYITFFCHDRSLRSQWGCCRSKAAASQQQLHNFIPEKWLSTSKLHDRNSIPNEHKKTNNNLRANDDCVQPGTTRFKSCWIKWLSSLS